MSLLKILHTTIAINSLFEIAESHIIYNRQTVHNDFSRTGNVLKKAQIIASLGFYNLLQHSSPLAQSVGFSGLLANASINIIRSEQGSRKIKRILVSGLFLGGIYITAASASLLTK